MQSHIFSCPVRWADLDIYGVVNNVSFLRLLEEARVDLVWRTGSQDRREGDAFFEGGSVVVRHSIEYRKPLFYTYENVDIEMWVSDLKYSQVTIEYVVRDGEKVYAVATTTMAPFNYAGKFPRRLTDEEMRFFLGYLNSGKRASGRELPPPEQSRGISVSVETRYGI
ncbi:MAG: acyl-CoA thioesterase [Alphaproteobacteria bacterium]|jgi:acyl-CoA thioester hydrolase|nr:acyl-CoA thioesterase [Alphaproteobacteria bacterium]MBU1550104.1 acyl-CoA thioesterase [Alphaproteobacteria bacterium]MBU2337094.1 acyl-CoA thioesterase [Alphaproteobacteria bacterium]MBU2389425.1 acyl-CoA thioesterase [Alphaproteobacteria bacterium]|tara:strand:+ start:144 stop:644 length:501 start_codon:yes stop_codon:yes gene_type:complete